MTKKKSQESTHRVINCVVCGAPRTIRLQDVFQVDKCKECQHQSRLDRRNELRAIEKAKAAKE